MYKVHGPRAPGGAMWLQSLLLCLPLSLTLSGPRELEAPEDAGELHCGPKGLQFTAHSPSQQTGMPPTLTAWDDHGLPLRLQNDSGCSTRVTEGPGSSVVVEVPYSSCFVTQWDSHHIMPVRVEGMDASGHSTVAETRMLKCPMGLPALTDPGADLCDSVPVWDRLLCVPSPTTQRDCNMLGCCFDPSGKSCYYGNTVTSYCTQDGHFSIAVARNVTSPPLLLNSVHLAVGNDSDCNPMTATQAFALFRFPFTSCGTTRRKGEMTMSQVSQCHLHLPLLLEQNMQHACLTRASPASGSIWPAGRTRLLYLHFQISGDQAVYENELVAARDVRTWRHGSITRDSIFRLRVSCTYTVSSNALPVQVQVSILPPPLPETQPGTLTLELEIAKDKNYSSYYSVGDYPVVKLLRDPIYVEVSVRHRTDPDLGLLLHQCWATPSPDPLHQPQWALLVKGCPYTGDNYQTQLIPVQAAAGLPFPSHYQRFSIFTFSFVDSVARRALQGPVYLHCSVSICQPAGTLACVTCPVARRRRSFGSHFHNSTASISSKGPMFLLQATKDASGKLRKYSSSPVGSQVLWVAGLSGTLAAGVLLMSYLALKKRR